MSTDLVGSNIKPIFVEVLTNFFDIMKKILIAIAALAVTINASAEGYQINTLSAKQLGMGHAGVALKLGAESMIFNPGALGFSDKTFDLTGSITGIKAIATAEYQGKDYTTENGWSTPMAFNAAFRIYDNLQAGISFYTPYGSGINWTQNWPGALLSQKVSLKMFTVQPTVAWRPIKNLSVGVGMMITWGNVNLDKGLVPGSTFDMVAGAPVLGDVVAASVNLTGTSQMALGANIGVLYDFTPQWSVGASFRTKMTMKVKAGEASVSYANEVVKAALEPSLGNIHQANFAAEMPAPYVFNMGVAYRPTDRWTVAADAQLTGWNAYKSLNIDFPSPLDAFDQNIPKNYKNSWAVKLGAQYAVTDRFDVRAGMMFDTTPVNSDYYNPETPGMTKISPTVGFSFRPTSGLSIDLAFMYVAGLGVDNAKCTYKDLVLQSAGMPESVYTRTFEANYRVHAFNPSIGISYSF